MIYNFNKNQINSDKLMLEIKDQVSGLVAITFDSGVIAVEFISEVDESLLNYIIENHNHDAFVPNAINPRQLRLALLDRGITSTMVENAIEQMAEPIKSKAQIEWEYGLTFERINPLVSPIGSILGYNSEQIDNLWIYAATL